MTTWVYIFSQFTAEALLFEALIILLLCLGYALFWVLRKRRYGVIDTSLPAGPVKTYLTELIINAEQLRQQLFGLLGGKELAQLTGGVLGKASTDAALAKKLTELEKKMEEQTRALDTIAAEKARIEKDLVEAQSAAASITSAPQAQSMSNADTAKFTQKIQDLESKLAEYNVIEDDLANLKRLQQENANLKATLAGKGIPVPAAAPEAPSAPPPVAAAPAPAPVAEAPAPPAAPAAAGPEGDVFAGLASQVEGSLQQANPDPAAAAAAGEAPPADGGGNPAPVKSENEKAEADLVAEFEKMLKG